MDAACDDDAPLSTFSAHSNAVRTNSACAVILRADTRSDADGNVESH